MIKIYDMNEVRDQDIFLRHDAVKDVSQPVAERFKSVGAKMPRSVTTPSHSLGGVTSKAG